jgi:pimeloyl-ACP methyl ester carboxylesterase
MRRLVLLTALTLILTLAPMPTAQPSAQPSAQARPATREAAGPAFVATRCPDLFPAKRDVDCGYVRVPEDRSKAHGRTIKVAAAVVHAKSDDPAPDPIVFLDGGPSFGAIAPFALHDYFFDWPSARDHDIVLVDTRGTGFSTPLLACPEVDKADPQSFYAPPTLNSQAPRIFGRALDACWRRLVREGVDPRAYTTAESAADLEALRRALGIKQWNVFGVSADGVLAATYARLYPDHIRTLVFDSSMAPQAEWGPDFDRGMFRLMEKIFAGCRANKACRSTYPHIRRRFFHQVRRLQAHPVLIRFPDFKPHPVSLEIDGVGFFADAMGGIYPGDLYGTPSLLLDPLEYIWRVSHGQIRDIYREWFGEGPVTNPHTNDFLAQGKTMSYACHDLVNFLTTRDLRQAARDLPAFAPRYLDPDYDLGLGFISIVSPAGCRHWPVGRAGASQHEPVVSDIPALLLTGEYDTGIVPYVVRHLRRGLTQHYFYEFPASGHLQLAVYNNGHACAREITATFLTDPTVAPDSTCLADLPAADFTPSTPGGHGTWSPGRPARTAPWADRG